LRKPDNYVSGVPESIAGYDKIINHGFFLGALSNHIYTSRKRNAKETVTSGSLLIATATGDAPFSRNFGCPCEFKEQMELRGVKRKPIHPGRSMLTAKL
jgi:hypothetical protein